MNVQPDHLWKLAFRMLMQDMVKFFFPEKYDEVDWTKEIVFLDKELNTIQADSRPKNRIADVLVALTLKTGKPLYVFLHIEVQGYPDAHFDLRVHQMGYRIEDKMGEMPVMLSILTDDDPNFHPKQYHKETWGTSVLRVFNTYKVLEHPPETYIDPDNPVALMMEIIYTSTQINKATDEDIMKSFVGLVKKLIAKGYSKQYILLMKNFIEAHIKFGNSKNYRNFEKKIDKMVKYETTADILSYWDFDKRLEVLQKSEKKARLIAERLQKKEALARKKEALARRDAELARQDAERKQELAVLGMLNQGLAKEIIARICSVTIEDITAIQEKYKDNNPITAILNGYSKN